MASRAKSASKTAEEEDDEGFVEDDFDEDEGSMEGDMANKFEAALAARGGAGTWRENGVQKDVVIRLLIQCFGSMIESHPKPNAVIDNRGKIRLEDMDHRKLIDASRHIVKARE